MCSIELAPFLLCSVPKNTDKKGEMPSRTFAHSPSPFFDILSKRLSQPIAVSKVCRLIQILPPHPDDKGFPIIELDWF
ncbi:hypothetical protein CEXT_3071 [Caerostris extrusa]|uniref:Uncharacterized protein n=1 Tax=Caerostris extrusa TaxID=172846 RepID=A0AAV4WJV3_CAEEX|nr:hypothetical protein CEXT_3071 [Caerostris extrusa]